jgi:3-deoxy-D-manno-octulosonic acid (KDO) 8-phosphate synthase
MNVSKIGDVVEVAVRRALAQMAGTQLLGCEIGLDQPLFLIAGPCGIESEELQLRTTERLKGITDRLGVHFIFKSSFDKANAPPTRAIAAQGWTRAYAFSRR